MKNVIKGLYIGIKKNPRVRDSWIFFTIEMHKPYL
jgi:hypothetical protein